MALVDNGGTATIAAGNNVPDRSGSGNIVIGSSGSNYAGDNGGNGFVTMSGGTLSGNGSAGPYAAEFSVMGEAAASSPKAAASTPHTRYSTATTTPPCS